MTSFSGKNPNHEVSVVVISGISCEITDITIGERLSELYKLRCG